jgi:5-amino-6-(5-phospho-D-ribitylamino)uracil phosphatase
MPRQLLIAVDVDGTLLNTEFEDKLGTREIEALDAVRKSGHILALCTGRNHRSVAGLMEQSGWQPDDLPLALLNGAVVWGGLPYRRLACNSLGPEEIKATLELFQEHGAVPMLYGNDNDGGILHHESRPVNDILGRYLAMREDSVGGIFKTEDLLAENFDTALEIGTIDKRETVLALSASVRSKLGARVKVINTRSLLGNGKFYWAEVFNGASDKGFGLKTLATEYGIPVADTLVIGDNYNDLDMFEAAGFSVAMGNSPADVKDKADLITDSVTQSGAAAILEKVAAGHKFR